MYELSSQCPIQNVTLDEWDIISDTSSQKRAQEESTRSANVSYISGTRDSCIIFAGIRVNSPIATKLDCISSVWRAQGLSTTKGN